MGLAARSYAGILAATLLGAAASAGACAAEIQRLSVHYSGALDLQLRVLIDAPVARVASILNDPDDLAHLLPGATSVRILPGAPSGSQRLSVQLQGCLLFFCPSLTDVMDLRRERSGFVGDTVPALSDFSAGQMSWRYLAEPGDRTLLYLHAHLVPRIWVPPLIGPYLIETKVENQMKTTVRRLERAAKGGPLRVPHRPEPINIPGFNF